MFNEEEKFILNQYLDNKKSKKDLLLDFKSTKVNSETRPILLKLYKKVEEMENKKYINLLNEIPFNLDFDIEFN